MLKEQLQQLASVQDGACVSISLATHRTHPDNLADKINLKNALKEAETRVLQEFDKRSVAGLLENLEALDKEVNHDYNSEGMFVFVSNNIKEVIRTAWPPDNNSVDLDHRFSLRNLIKAYNRSSHYYILYLSQSGVHLFEAEDDRITEEIKEGGFPLKENTHYHTDNLKKSDPKNIDNKLKEYFNRVDKAVVREIGSKGLPCIVSSTPYNYEVLQAVADVPQLYSGHIPVDYNNNDQHHLAKAAWEVIKEIQKQERADAIDEMFGAVSSGKVVTDVQEIWRAAHEGRGELLIVSNSLSIPAGVLSSGLSINEEKTTPGVTDDIVNDVAWEIISKNGKVYFTDQPALAELGEMALKVRY